MATGRSQKSRLTSAIKRQERILEKAKKKQAEKKEIEALKKKKDSLSKQISGIKK